MGKINYNDNVHSRGRKLHLQTNIIDNNGKIISTLYDGGRVIFQDEIISSPEISSTLLDTHILQIHKSRVTSIELLYNISAKIKTVRHPVSLNKLGLQFLKWNLLDEAISEFQLAIQYDAGFGNAYIHLGEAYRKRGSFSEMISILENGVKSKPHYADMWCCLGKAYYLSQSYQKGIQNFQKALKINGSFDEPYFYIALCLLSIHSNDKEIESQNENKYLSQARDYLNRTAALSERFRTELFQEAFRQLHKGNVNDALALLQNVESGLEKEVNLEFDDAFYLNYMYGESGRDSEAIKSYVTKLEDLIQQHSKYPDLHNKLGVGYLMQCRDLFNKALSHFQKACTLNPKYEKAKNNLKLAKNDGKGLILLLRAMLK